jgi:sulfate adenylyltransferase/3'-phosphoadenosine 5'-phosphosulfate synthase
LWFTGLSGSGKSTLAALVSAELRRRGVHVETLDGDEIRKNLSKGLGFSKEDRDANVRRVGFVARLVARSGGCAVTAAISPYRAVRDEVRASVDCFCEVFCDCPIGILAARDPKGLYEKALRGEIKNFTGVDDPYEAPSAPDVHLRTDQETPEASAHKILTRLEELGFLGGAGRSAHGELALPYGGDLVEGLRSSATSAHGRPPRVLDAEEERAVVGLGLGLVAPLRGFMGSRDAYKVGRERHLERGLPWPEPLLLRGDAEVGDELALLGSKGDRLGSLHVSERWQSADGLPHLAGDVRLERLPEWAKACRSTVSFRRDEAERGPLVGLPLFGLPTRADEHWARNVLERGERLVLLPVLSSETTPQLVAACQVWTKDYLEPSRVVLAPLPLPYGRCAVWAELLAIYAQNMGIARLLVSASWLEQVGAPSKRVGVTELTTTIDALPPLRFDEHIGGFVSVRSKRYGEPPPIDERAHEVRPEVAASGRAVT